MQQREISIDALRGFAILTMVLSGSIAFGDTLPAWMYHAQVPPPLHKFNSSIAGITWVDLVFPFFLFSMGAAMPLALKKYIDANKSFLEVFKIAIKRLLLLTFFALFLQHMKAWVIGNNPALKEQLFSMLGFIVLFFIFYENKNTLYKKHFSIVKITAWLMAILLLYQLPFWNGKGFDLYKSDIIIIVLANMAFWGTILYFLTANKPFIRLGILPFLMALFLAAKEPSNSWAKEVFNFNHIGAAYFDWMYQFYYLKYLFIVIPGTIAGEYLLSSLIKKNQPTNTSSITIKNKELFITFIGIALIVLNLYGLFTRQLTFNLIGTAILCALAIKLVYPLNNENAIKKIIYTGSYFLLLGLFFEAYEGGIKKDFSTYSYYFTTSGLAFFCLATFSILAKNSKSNYYIEYLALNGKNPMIAYVTGSLLLLPILSITQTKVYWEAMNQNVLMGCLKGILFTAIVSLITVWFTNKQWFWKT